MCVCACMMYSIYLCIYVHVHVVIFMMCMYQIIKRNTIKHSAISIYILRLYRHRLNTLTCIIPELDEGDTCPAYPKVIDV